MSEQLALVVSGTGKLEARGPVWRWWLGDKEHWVAYPDNIITVADLPDDHLTGILTYLKGWSPVRVEKLKSAWWRWSAHMRYTPRGEMAQVALGHEIDALADQTDREWLERYLVPCLPRLEGEARKRGIPVPTIPSYIDPIAVKRLQQEAEHAAFLTRLRPLPQPMPKPPRPVRAKGRR